MTEDFIFLLATLIREGVQWFLDVGGSVVGLVNKKRNQALLSLYPSSWLKLWGLLDYFTAFPG
jgi:hypothetical protein